MLAGIGIAVCVGVVVAVWVAGALYNALHNLHNGSHAPRERTPSQRGSTALIVVAVACAVLAVVSRSHFDSLAVGALWVQVLGLAVLEEHLMLATFPKDYPRYRRQVPQLVPGLVILRRRHSVSS